MKVAVGSDHAGFLLKQKVIARLEDHGYSVVHKGAESTDRYDYPDASDEVCQSVLKGECERGVLICGSGIGVSIRANRYRGIRAALCTSTEMAGLARLHNFANVLCLGERTTQPQLALAILDAFMNGAEDHAGRHEVRVQKLDLAIESRC
ncbi:MAG: ribose 5-phosphate isomerase B [Fimbriimonadaceae bacterium]|jgi:ribose 5-phosphate isomerase B|nr:ribose 5-phosphate isomerase B [Fimbriimonadaceae bacterium]